MISIETTVGSEVPHRVSALAYSCHSKARGPGESGQRQRERKSECEFEREVNVSSFISTGDRKRGYSVPLLVFTELVRGGKLW